MQFACRRSADEKRDVDASLSHGFGNLAHLVERRGDESAESHEIHFLLLDGLYYLLGRSHYPQVDYVEVVASQHHRHDVLSYVVNVALHRGNEIFAVALASALPSLLYVWLEDGNGVFHRASRLHHLWQEHLSLAEQVAHRLHAFHERPLYYLCRFGIILQSLHEVSLQIFVVACAQCRDEPFLQGSGRTVDGCRFFCGRVLFLFEQSLCHGGKPFRSILSAV